MELPREFTMALFTLPDNRFVLQRRTFDAPYGPGLLGTFGGAVEPGETADDCIAREIREEVSIDPADITITKHSSFTIPADNDYPVDRQFHVYTVPIESLDFEVYEGTRAEAYTSEQIRQRPDNTGAVAYLFKHVITTGA